VILQEHDPDVVVHVQQVLVVVHVGELPVVVPLVGEQLACILHLD